MCPSVYQTTFSKLFEICIGFITRSTSVTYEIAIAKGIREIQCSMAEEHIELGFIDLRGYLALLIY